MLRFLKPQYFFLFFGIFVSRSWGSDEKAPKEIMEKDENNENLKPNTSLSTSSSSSSSSSGVGSSSKRSIDEDDEEDMNEVTFDMDSLKNDDIPNSFYPSQNRMKKYADQSIPSHELTQKR